MASDVTSGTLGMDHRAIVWCHDLLAQVRQIIHVMTVFEDPFERLQSLLNPPDFGSSVAMQKDAFRVSEPCFVIAL